MLQALLVALLPAAPVRMSGRVVLSQQQLWQQQAQQRQYRRRSIALARAAGGGGRSGGNRLPDDSLQQQQQQHPPLEDIEVAAEEVRPGRSRREPDPSDDGRGSNGSSDGARNGLSGVASMFAVAALWGSNPVALRYLFTTDTPPHPALLMALQCGAASLLLLALKGAATARSTASASSNQQQQQQQGFQQQQQQQLPLWQRVKAWWRSGGKAGVELGLLAFAANAITIVGFQHSTATRGAFLFRLSAAFTPVVAALGGQRVAASVWPAVALALLGSLLLATAGEGGGGGGAEAIAAAEAMGGGGGAEAIVAAEAMGGGGSVGGVGGVAMDALSRFSPGEGLAYGDGMLVLAAVLWSVQTVRVSTHASSTDALRLAATQLGVMAALSLPWLAVDRALTSAALAGGAALTGTTAAASGAALTGTAAAASGAALAGAAAAASGAALAGAAGTAAAATAGGATWWSAWLWPGAYDPLAWAVLLWPAVGPWGTGTWLQFRAQGGQQGGGRVPPAVAQLVLASDPLWTALLAGLLGASEQQMGPAGWAGAAAILAASLLASRSGSGGGH